MMRQHAVHLSSLVKQPGQMRDAATQASKAVLNNKLSWEKWFVSRKSQEVDQSLERLMSIWKRISCLSVDVFQLWKAFYHIVISNAKTENTWRCSLMWIRQLFLFIFHFCVQVSQHFLSASDDRWWFITTSVNLRPFILARRFTFRSASAFVFGANWQMLSWKIKHYTCLTSVWAC